MSKGYLILEDGSVYGGILIGTGECSTGEVVFNTNMTGYQETLTDPSYYGQIIMMTYPLIGNYGINEIFDESDKSWVRGFIVNELCNDPSNRLSKGTLNDYLVNKGVTGLKGVDVRAITRKTREAGTMRGRIINRLPNDEDIKMILSYNIVNPVNEVTAKEKYVIKGGKKSVAVIDLGVKRSILKHLVALGYDVAVYPAITPCEDILRGKHCGLMLTNGPGDPKDNTEVIENIRKLIGRIPIFGICLGHQLIALACGGNTFKLKYGHRGGNHPVMDLATNEICVTSQNHGYAVDNTNISRGEISHINLNDRTVEGVIYPSLKAFTVQFHPEAAPGPLDSYTLFGRFKELMERNLT